MSFFRADVGVGQRSALYITPIFHILEKRTKNLLISILIYFLSFVDNVLFIFQERNFEKLNANLFCSYRIIPSLFKQFSLSIKHDKSEIFHFFRLTKNFNPPPLYLRPLKGMILKHTNKALSIIKSMKMLDNSTRDFQQCTSISYIEYVYFLLHYMVFSSGVSKKCHYTSFSKS